MSNHACDLFDSPQVWDVMGNGRPGRPMALRDVSGVGGTSRTRGAAALARFGRRVSRISIEAKAAERGRAAWQGLRKPATRWGPELTSPWWEGGSSTDPSVCPLHTSFPIPQRPTCSGPGGRRPTGQKRPRAAQRTEGGRRRLEGCVPRGRVS